MNIVIVLADGAKAEHHERALGLLERAVKAEEARNRLAARSVEYLGELFKRAYIPEEKKPDA